MKDRYYIAIVIIFAVGVWAMGEIFKNDHWVGFYYPNADDLREEIQSEDVYNTFAACHAWVDEQIQKNNPSGLTRYEYNCSKNCDLSGPRPYVCEEVISGN